MNISRNLGTNSDSHTKINFMYVIITDLPSATSDIRVTPSSETGDIEIPIK
jgi:hypothetical protein